MILFVCTGNTCRSPMAEGIAVSRGVDARSAGLAALPGALATPRAVEAAARYGADLSGHRARQVTGDMLLAAQAVYVMTPGHAAALKQAYPACAGKVRVLAPAIPDPFGGDDRVYRACAQSIFTALQRAGILQPENPEQSKGGTA